MINQDDATKDSLLVKSVGKAFRVLDTFDQFNSQQTLAQITARADLDRSAAQRFAHTLLELGYLVRTKDKAFELSSKTLSFAYNYTRSNRLIQRAHPYLLHLNRTTGETISLTVRDGTQIIYIARYLSQNTIDNDVIVGSRLPAYCTAAGWVYMAHMPDSEIVTILNRSDLQAYTPKTICDVDNVFKKVNETRTRGFAIADEQVFSNDLALSMPITDKSDGAVGAITLAASNLRYSQETLIKEFMPLIMSTSRSISQNL